jgi:hypothetical protein
MRPTSNLLALLFDALCAVIVATVVLAVMTNLNSTIAKNATVYTTKAGNFQHIDFISYYMAGTLARADKATREKAYDPAVQMAQYNKVIAPASIHRPIFFNYPPYSFPIMSLFARMPLRQAYLTWDQSSATFAAAALILAGRAAGALGLAPAAVLAILFIFSFPGSDALIDGQTTFWAMGLIALSYFGIKRNNDLLAGLATALLAVKPHYFLFMIIPHIVSALKGRLGPLLYAAAGCAALLIAGIYYLGLDQTLNYPKIALAGENIELCPMTYPERMVCLRGPASIIFSHQISMQVGLVSFLIGLVVMFLLFKKARSLEWAYALAIPVLLSFSPHMHVYDCALLAVTACLLLPDLRPSKILRGPESISFKILCLLLLSYVVVSWMIMVLAPEIGKALLPPDLQAKLSVNNISCALLSFPTFLIFDLLLLGLGLVAVGKKEGQARLSQ